MTDDQGQKARKWFDDAEEALDRAAEALKSAWDETRDVRMSTLEAAREAANRLGAAIDQGIEAAKHAWDQPSAEGGHANSDSGLGGEVEPSEEEE